MIKFLIPIAAVAAAGLACAPMPARADFSACGSALDAKDPHQQISLYSICLKHGGIPATDVSSAFNNRAVAYEQVGQIDKAFQDFTSAIQYDPNWPNPYVGRAGIESGRGRCKEAVADLDKALKLDPRRAPFLNRAAWVLATCDDPAVRDGRRAVELAQQALKIVERQTLKTKDDSGIHDTLAAAYAETGQFDQAQAEETKAIQAAAEQPVRVEGMQARLELYHHGLAFHARSGPEAASATDH